MVDPKKAFVQQKSRAEARGIEFKLTFEQWLGFWGSDLNRRGRGRDCLQMQRFADRGAYEVGNIKKGTPRENAATMGRVKRGKNSIERAEDHQRHLDRLMHDEHAEDCSSDDEESELAHLGYASSFDRQYVFAADKDR